MRGSYSFILGSDELNDLHYKMMTLKFRLNDRYTWCINTGNFFPSYYEKFTNKEFWKK